MSKFVKLKHPTYEPNEDYIKFTFIDAIRHLKDGATILNIDSKGVVRRYNDYNKLYNNLGNMITSDEILNNNWYVVTYI